MSVLIKGMKMPEESILMTVHNGSAYVIPVGEDEGKTYEVIEVKTPHGRLIDINTLVSGMYDPKIGVSIVADTVIGAED